MTHDVTVSAAECAECVAADPMGSPMPYGLSMLRRAKEIEHIQAQEDALYAAAVAAFGPEPIKRLIDLTGGNQEQFHYWLEEFIEQLRAQMEAKK